MINLFGLETNLLDNCSFKAHYLFKSELKHFREKSLKKGRELFEKF